MFGSINENTTLKLLFILIVRNKFITLTRVHPESSQYFLSSVLGIDFRRHGLMMDAHGYLRRRSNPRRKIRRLFILTVEQ